MRDERDAAVADANLSRGNLLSADARIQALTAERDALKEGLSRYRTVEGFNAHDEWVEHIKTRNERDSLKMEISELRGIMRAEEHDALIYVTERDAALSEVSRLRAGMDTFKMALADALRGMTDASLKDFVAKYESLAASE